MQLRYNFRCRTYDIQHLRGVRSEKADQESLFLSELLTRSHTRQEVSGS